MGISIGKWPKSINGQKSLFLRAKEMGFHRAPIEFWKLVFLTPPSNELPLRHLFEAIDGNTSGKESWTGPLGKMLPKVEELPLDPDFTVIEGGDLPDLSEDEVGDLSQRLTFRFRNFSVSKLLPIFWRFQFRYRKIWFWKKSLGFGFEKIRSRK